MAFERNVRKKHGAGQWGGESNWMWGDVASINFSCQREVRVHSNASFYLSYLFKDLSSKYSNLLMILDVKGVNR